MAKILNDSVYQVDFVSTTGAVGNQKFTGRELKAMFLNESQGFYDIKKLLNWKSYIINGI
jgi:hypothetical protein